MTATDMGITEQLARFVGETTYESLPLELIIAAKRAWIDTIGVTLAGSREEAGEIGREYAKVTAAAEDALVLGTTTKTSPALAALANGIAGHALDYDDMSKGLNGHPSVPLVPAVLAIAERDGKSGRDALLAFVIGFEITAKIGNAMGPSSYSRGWHATSVVGTIGAAAAVAKLLNLDVTATRHALGIAVSMASGSRQNFGSMTKPLHAGLAARAGIEAATLASLGFTADETAIESPLGFGALYSPADDWRPELVTDLGEPWDLVSPGLCVKQYPCCYNTHLALDAAFNASGRKQLTEADIAAIDVHVAEGSTPALIHHRPITGLAGKFSMEYCVTAAVLDGAVKLASFEDDAVARPEAQSLLRRVNISYGPEPEARVVVRLNSGEALNGLAAFEHGSDSDPLSWDELTVKYRDCASLVLTPEAVDASLKMLSDLESVASIRSLTDVLKTA
ncbi:MAG: MmgE/PrpD family protein [Dehalococcoidia bacterium]